MLRDAQSIFRHIVEDLGVECFIAHSTLWNGPEDIKGATEAVLKLVNDEDLASGMGKNAAKRASELTLSKITQNLIERLERMSANI